MIAGDVPPYPEPVSPSEPIDVTAFVKDARKRDGNGYFDRFCPSAYKDFNPDHPDIRKNAHAIQTVLNYKIGTKGLILTGPTNLGKTRVLWQLLRRLYAENGVECRWYHAMDFFTELQECIKYGRDDAKGWVDSVAWRRCVFLDDIGQEANLKSREDWAEGWFFRFLDLRLERKLPLFITTNLTAKDMAHRQNDIRSDPFLRRVLDICDVVKFA